MLLGLFLTCACALSRHDFENDDYPFFTGAATAAFQVEGAWNADGKGPSIWDQWSHEKGHIFNGETADVADDEYHRIAEDIALLASLNFKAYRFSISWPRVVPTGYVKDGINKAGLEYYARVLELVRAHGMMPLVTLFHWDTPLGFFPNATAGEPVGWLRDDIVTEYVAYARLCFEYFRDIPYWLTFNEPLSFIKNGYGAVGTQAPGRCSNRTLCPAGNSQTEPYLAGHRVLLAHAGAVNAFRALGLPGKIGITLDLTYTVPLDESSPADVEAHERGLLFQVGWWAHPIHFGDYPSQMRQLLGDRLPTFGPSVGIKGTSDFFGLNHYTSAYVSGGRQGQPSDGWSWDQNVTYTHERNGQPIGPRAASVWLYVYPPGFYGALAWVNSTYAPAEIIVTENGVDVPGEVNLRLPEVLDDSFRQEYYEQYLLQLQRAVRDGVPVHGYCAWSILDNFEWAMGYDRLFGITWIDRQNNLTRHVKASGYWWKHFNT